MSTHNEPNEQANRLMPRWVHWIDRFSTGLAVIAGVALIGMMCNIVAEVLARTLYRPIPGTLDLTQFVWMPMIISLGLGYALLMGQHIQVTLLTDAASERVKRVSEILAQALTLVAAAAFAWFGFERALAATIVVETPTSTPWLPIWVIRWVLVIGVVGLMLQAVAQIARAVLSFSEVHSAAQPLPPISPSQPISTIGCSSGERQGEER